MIEPPIVVDEPVGQAGSRFYLIAFAFHGRGIDFDCPTRSFSFSNWSSFKKNYLRKIQKHLL